MDFRSLTKGAATAKRMRERVARNGMSWSGAKLWTEEEEALCRKLFPDHNAIAKALPHRSYRAIRIRCIALGLRAGRVVQPFTAREQSALKRDFQTFSWPELMNRYGNRSPASIELKAREMGARRPRRPYAPTGDSLLDELRRECFRHKITMRDLDEFASSGNYFSSQLCKGRGVKYDHVVRAIRELGGTIKVEWSQRLNLLRRSLGETTTTKSRQPGLFRIRNGIDLQRETPYVICMRRDAS